MQTHFDLEKAIQATGVLLRREGKRMSRLRLLKLLYIADRRCLKESGRPIIGSRVVAMKHGPLHSHIYELINGSGAGEPIWSEHFINDGRDIMVDVEPEATQLSRFEVAILNKVVDELVSLDDWEVADLTHGFSEWIKNYPDVTENTSRNIPLEDIIAGIGRSADAPSIIEELRDSEAFNQFFANLPSGVPT